MISVPTNSIIQGINSNMMPARLRTIIIEPKAERSMPIRPLVVRSALVRRIELTTKRTPKNITKPPII